MAFVQLDANGNVTGIFAAAQNDPAPPGYAVLSDGDPRIAAFLAAEAKPPYMPPTPRQWLERLAPATQAAIMKAAMGDATDALIEWLFKAAGTPAIDVTSAETQQGVAALVSAGIITAADQQTLLAP